LALVYDPAWPLPELCLWEKLFGYCPARETVRALHWLLRGHFQESLRTNTKAMVIILVGSAIAIRDMALLACNSLVPILGTGQGGINLNYYTGRFEPSAYLP